MIQATSSRPRHDGWTVARQVRFLAVLRITRSVATAARAAGMSRESAHRLRKREPGGLFAAMWDSCLPPRATLERQAVDEGQMRIIRLACGSQGKNLRIDRATSTR